jgi:hypothetical protein
VTVDPGTVGTQTVQVLRLHRRGAGLLGLTVLATLRALESRGPRTLDEIDLESPISRETHAHVYFSARAASQKLDRTKQDE